MQSFCVRWGGWISRTVAILLTAAYIIVISFVHNSPYVWLSLILVLLLCISLFAYTRERPIIRWRRYNNPQPTANDQDEEPQMTEVPAAIWMTDIPPSYSYVMATNPPVTPPPTYGSALIMFPWIANGQQSPDISRIIENTKFRSISRQVSETSGIIFNYNGSLSRQTSRVDVISNRLSPSLLSRQTSRQDGTSIISKQLSAISRQISQATVLSRQISLQENKQSEHQEEEEEEGEEEGTNKKTEMLQNEDGNNLIFLELEEGSVQSAEMEQQSDRHEIHGKETPNDEKIKKRESSSKKE